MPRVMTRAQWEGLAVALGSARQSERATLECVERTLSWVRYDEYFAFLEVDYRIHIPCLQDCEGPVCMVLPSGTLGGNREPQLLRLARPIRVPEIAAESLRGGGSEVSREVGRDHLYFVCATRVEHVVSGLGFDNYVERYIRGDGLFLDGTACLGYLDFCNGGPVGVRHLPFPFVRSDRACKAFRGL